jgi:hypothetical protein
MFRFTIRDVLWLTVVVALAVGWWVERNRAIHARKAAIDYWDSTITPQLLDEYLTEYGRKRDDRPILDVRRPPRFDLPPLPHGFAWTLAPDGSELSVQPSQSPADPATPDRP